MKINELVLKNRFVVENDPVAPTADPNAAPAAATTPTAPKPPAAAPAAKGPGLWDQIKQGANKLQAGIAGAKAGYTGSQAQQAGQAEAEEIGSMYFKKWNSAIGQNPALNTAANLQAFMQNSTKKSGIKVPPPPAGELNPAVTSKYIIDVIGKSFAASDLGLPSERQDDTVPQQPQAQQQAAADSTAPVAPEVPAAQQQAATDPPATTSTDQAATQTKSYGNSTSVTPTNVTQQPSTVATTQTADELIANAKPEELEAMLAALQGAPT
jgi:hypothetical protein